ERLGGELQGEQLPVAQRDLQVLRRRNRPGRLWHDIEEDLHERTLFEVQPDPTCDAHAARVELGAERKHVESPKRLAPQRDRFVVIQNVPVGTALVYLI